jgi:prepilin-type N-terminal cleavage/methylation domain-containing protein
MKRIGYTLTEIMIVLAVLAVLSGAVYFIVSSGRDAVESVDVRAQLSDGARVANRDTVTVDGAGEVTSFVDPLNNETHQILIFASARGDPAAPAEDGQHASNDYVHRDSAYKANWRSVVVYCTYVTPEGIQQLRKYVYYNNSYNFPFTFVGVTANAINLAGLVIPRNSGSVRANYITSEVAGPANNNDGVIDNGADFTISGSLMKIKFFLSKLELPTRGGSRMLTATLTDSVVMRNK